MAKLLKEVSRTLRMRCKIISVETQVEHGLHLKNLRQTPGAWGITPRPLQLFREGMSRDLPLGLRCIYDQRDLFQQAGCPAC